MSKNELVFLRVEVPEEYKEIPEMEDPLSSARCVICRHSLREAIESVGYSGMSMRAASDYIRDNLGIDLTPRQMTHHLHNHCTDARSLKFSQLYSGMGDIPEDSPVATAEGIVLLMLGDAMKKMLSGEIEMKRVEDVDKAVRLFQSAQRLKLDEKRLAQEEQSGTSAMDAMRQLGYIMLALRETVPAHLLEEAVTRAWSLGLSMDYTDISEVPVYKSDYREPDMTLAVRDIASLGRKRTREELDDGGWEDVPPDE